MALLPTLQEALASHQAGDLTRAAQGYSAILCSHPESVDALHYFGILEAQRGRYPEALALFERALGIDPHLVEVLASRGSVLEALGRSEEALGSYDRALVVAPDNAAVLFNRCRLLQGIGRFREALASYNRCLALAPDLPGAMFNRGVLLQKLGRHEEALASYDQALAAEANDADALNNRGTVLFDLHRFDEALSSYEQALALRPGFPEALNNRGNSLRELGRLQEALASCNDALAMAPGFAEAHNSRGMVLNKLGRRDEARASFERALALDPAFGEAHNNLGQVLRDQGRLAEAVASYRRAVELMPKSIDANTNLSVALHHIVQAWHVPMMNDAMRNNAYVRALTAAITPNTHVLEIGTGSGLLAMVAARLGARRVITCEAIPLIASTARDIIAANGWSSSVSVIPKLSSELVVGEDLPQRATLLMSEILSSELLGEGVLDSIEDAKKRLLESDARIIPEAGSIVVALTGGEDVRKNIMVDDVLGLDMSAFNAISLQKRYIHRQDLDVGLLTDATVAFEFDFARRDHFPPERKTLRLPIKAAGRCYGIAQWIRVRLYGDVIFENHPATKTPASSWQTCFYRFLNPVDVEPGQTAVISAVHNRTAAWFFWEGLEA